MNWTKDDGPDAGKIAQGAGALPIDIDPETVNVLQRMLRSGSNQIDSDRFFDIVTDQFGESWSGSNLSHHTSLAHQVVADALVTHATDILDLEEKVLAYYASQEYEDIESRLRFQQMIEDLLSRPFNPFSHGGI